MSEEWEQQERAERDSDRSQEAHWRAAEAGAEEENRRSEEDPRRDDQEDEWENEGGALDRESAQGPGGPRQD